MTDSAVSGQSVIEGKVGAAGDSGNGMDTLAFQKMDDDISAAHFHNYFSPFDIDAGKKNRRGAKAQKNPHRFAPAGVGK
jgi:hypothetical protein